MRGETGLFMSRPNTRVLIAFDLQAGGGVNFFTLDDSVKGKLDNTIFRLGGEALEEVTSDVMQITSRRGRSRELERFQTGGATVALDNSKRKYDPAAGPAITPYGSSMRPRKAVEIYCNDVKVFVGFVDDWDLEYSLNGNHVSSVKVTDGFAILSQLNIDPHTTAEQVSSARVNAILDRSEIAWPEDKRSIDLGVAVLQADDIGGIDDPKPTPSLAYLQQVETAEQGALFISKDGHLTFRSRRSLQVLTDLSFTDDGSGVPFTNISASYGSEQLRNRITVTRLNGGSATATDNDSIAEFGAIDYGVTDVLFSDDTQAQTMADLILNRYSVPLLRIDSVEVILNSLTLHQQNQVLGLDLGSMVSVIYTPSGIGDPIEQFVSVDAIEHIIDPEMHKMRFNFSQGDEPSLVLDSATFGLLDTNALGF